MAENKKDKSAEFARDKSAFSKGGSEKGTASQKVQRRHSGTHQPRDANDTSGATFRKSTLIPCKLSRLVFFILCHYSTSSCFTLSSGLVFIIA